MKGFIYRLNRLLLKLIVHPTVTGGDNFALNEGKQVVYVLHHRSVTDLVMLDLVCTEHGFTSPFLPLDLAEAPERLRVFPLLRSAGGRITMNTHSSRLLRLIDQPAELKHDITLVPITVFWGRGMSEQGSLFSTLTSEDWAVTGRFKRLINLLINRRNIVVHIGRPISLTDVAGKDIERNIAIRRTARLLRVRLRQQKVTALGPDFSHRRTLLNQVVQSRSVRQVIDSKVAAGGKQKKLERQALRHARTIASDMSHTTIRVLSRILRWFWNRIYDGIETRGIHHLEAVSATHTLIYVPSHRSHLDYLLLSYLLYYEGFMIPHIAAGDNLNQPVLGSILRRGGAFFMRRSFRGDPLYTAVFNEYLYQVYRRGHSVEFFPEGGRTRSGRTMPAKFGLLKMTLEHQLRGLPKPLAFVPVYFSYEKVVEGSSYLSELRGATKKGESFGDVFRNIKLIRQNFGRVGVNLGPPIKLDQWLQEVSSTTGSSGVAHEASSVLTPTSTDQDDVLDNWVSRLGTTIMQQINNQATVNPVNLVALITLATSNSAIEEVRLRDQIVCYQTLLQKLYPDSGIRVCDDPPHQVISHVENLGLLNRYQEKFGDVLGHEPFAAVLMTWYRNNVVHTLALPSLIACLTVKRRRPISYDNLQRIVGMIYPYLAEELSWEIPNDKFNQKFDDCIATMHSLGLLNRKDNSFVPPPPGEGRHMELSLLANLVSQTLERMFIVIHLLGRSGFTLQGLQTSSQIVAQKISRLYGINAPEFFDRRLFDQFIHKLITNGVVNTLADGILVPDPGLDQVLRAAEFVIDPQVRYGVLSVSSESGH